MANTPSPTASHGLYTGSRSVESVTLGPQDSEKKCVAEAGGLGEILDTLGNPHGQDDEVKKDQQVRSLESKVITPPARLAQGCSAYSSSKNNNGGGGGGDNKNSNKTRYPRRAPPRNCVFLKVTVMKAKALVGELVDTRTSSGAPRTFAVDLQFNEQRARTRKEVTCCVEPDFGEESFVFVLREQAQLPVNAGGWASFVQADLPLHVTLIKRKPRARRLHATGNDNDSAALAVATGDERELVGMAEVDWRRALGPAGAPEDILHNNDANIGGVLLAVELASASPDSIVHPVGGILHLRLEVVAPREVSSFPFTANDVARVVALQVSVRNEERRDFYLYADSWWRSFMAISKGFHKRAVKIFAEDELGQHRCVCSFMVPYRQGRLLRTPTHAARFVSLLPFQRRASVGDQRSQSWNSPHAFLSAGRGDCADHALLLCSLLLGFGLDALVCVGKVVSTSEDDYEEGGGGDDGSRDYDHGGGGRQRETSHMWVCTFSGPRQQQKAFFWESLTGQRFCMRQPGHLLSNKGGRRTGGKAVVPVRAHHFSTVACMFSHREFFANKQADDRVGLTSLDVSDSARWKPMDSSRLIPAGGCNTTNAGPAGIVLLPPISHAEAMAEDMELELKDLIAKWRNNKKGLSTIWDDEMGYLLGPAVFAYEQERVSGVSVGNDDFQDAIQGAVPDKHCFKGYPSCFDQGGCSCNSIMSALLSNVISKDILCSAGDHLRFAVRFMVFPYPDGVMAVWLMLACRFQAPTAV